jgi:hypothetical protein
MSSIARLVALLDENGFDVMSVQAEGHNFRGDLGIGLAVKDRWTEGQKTEATKDEGTTGS